MQMSGGFFPGGNETGVCEWNIVHTLHDTNFSTQSDLHTGGPGGEGHWWGEGLPV